MGRIFASAGKHRLQGKKQKMILENLNRGQILKNKIHLVVMGGGIAKRPSNPTIRIRYPVNELFKINKPVFIGNRAKHAAYALEGGKIQKIYTGYG
ncbi:MAG: hypothetical protein CM15mV142_650 [Caudoviricetes sp.]|nr:MAG: hypothetical protein CM15mV142_650 [Caudoviricetes sp.]